jgi:hypothetical protein
MMFVNVTITLVLDSLMIVVIVQTAFVPSRLLGLIILMLQDIITSTWNVQERASVIDLLVSVHVSKATKERVVRDQHVLMTVLVTVDVTTSKIFRTAPLGMIG